MEKEKDEYNTYLGQAYRYLSFEGLFKTLETKSLRFTRVDCFNDPLDNSIFLAPFDWNEYAKEGSSYISFVQKYFQQVFTGSLYACCFCKEFDSENSYLMWSHYGNGHTQVCFEVDFSKNRYLGGPSEVTYPESLKEERDIIASKDSSKQGLYLVTTKTKQWSYEKEVRLIVDTNNDKVDTAKIKISHDSKNLFVEFDLTLISKTIFGVKAVKEDINKTINMFNERNLNPEYFKMRIDPVNLTLKADKLHITKQD